MWVGGGGIGLGDWFLLQNRTFRSCKYHLCFEHGVDIGRSNI